MVFMMLLYCDNNLFNHTAIEQFNVC